MVTGVARRDRRRPLLSAAHGRALLPPSPRRVLRDRGSDDRLRRDGFVTLPLVDARAADELAAVYGDLHGWSGEGFEPDLTNDDVAYRRAVVEELSARLSTVIGDRFLDCAPFIHNFLCKWPGERSDLYLHRDWMYVDEGAGLRTYVVWIPLVDVRWENGPLQVLRHSHRLDRMLRGTALDASWVSDVDGIAPHLLTVPVPAGTAVIMDNALVHRSPSNTSDQPRPVAAVVMRPVESVLVHHRRRAGSEEADRYLVDEEFFVTHTPRALQEAPPDLPVDAVVPAGDEGWTAAEVHAALRSSLLTRLDAARR